LLAFYYLGLLCLTATHFPSSIEKDKNHPTGQKRRIVCTTGAK